MSKPKPNYLYEAILDLNAKYDFSVENFYIKVANSTNALPLTESIIPHLHAVDIILFDDEQTQAFSTEAYQKGLLPTASGAYIRLTTNIIASNANSQDSSLL